MKKIFSYGIVRGMVGQIIATPIGFGLVAGIQALLGRPLNAEPAYVVGAVFGVLGFLIGLGAFSDWYRMALGEDVREPEEIQDAPGARRYWGLSFDHKVIGVQYGILSMILAGAGRHLCAHLPNRAGGFGAAVPLLPVIQLAGGAARHGADRLDLDGHRRHLQLRHPTADRRAGHGFPAPECVLFLGGGAGVAGAGFQPGPGRL